MASMISYAAALAGVNPSNATVVHEDHLVFPQVFHDTLAGKGAASHIHPTALKEGEPAVFFTTQDIIEMNREVKFTLIGKFLLGHPKMEFMRNYFDSLHFIGSWQLGLVDGRHLLIQMTVEEDYARLFAMQSVIIAGTSMKLLKWTPDFDPSKEPPVVPIWFKFPGLPLHLFKLNALFNIGSAFGTPLKVDAPTYNKARPAAARVLIERDITLPEMKRIWIGTETDGFWQEVVMEQKPYYCQHCRMFGHTENRCYRLHPPYRRKSKPNTKETDVGISERDQRRHQSVEPEEADVAQSTQNTPKVISKDTHSTEKRKNRREELPMEKETSGAETTHTTYILKPNVGTTADTTSSDEEWQVYTRRKKRNGSRLQLGNILDDTLVTTGNGDHLTSLLANSGSRIRSKGRSKTTLGPSPTT